MLLSKEQMSCFHVMGHTTFVSLQFSRKQICGHKGRYVLCIFATYSKETCGHTTFVVQTIKMFTSPICLQHCWLSSLWKMLLQWRHNICVSASCHVEFVSVRLTDPCVSVRRADPCVSLRRADLCVSVRLTDPCVSVRCADPCVSVRLTDPWCHQLIIISVPLLAITNDF